VRYYSTGVFNIEYRISNIEFRRKTECLPSGGFSVKFGAGILQGQKDFIIRHSLLDIGYSVAVKITAVFKAGTMPPSSGLSDAFRYAGGELTLVSSLFHRAG
jgi:hypothetical protein